MNLGGYRSLKRLKIVGVCDGAWVEGWGSTTLQIGCQASCTSTSCSLVSFSLLVETRLYQRAGWERRQRQFWQETRGRGFLPFPFFFLFLFLLWMNFKFNPVSSFCPLLYSRVCKLLFLRCTYVNLTRCCFLLNTLFL